jgi:hypothetical protein
MQWRVGNIEPVYDSRGMPAGTGFVLYDENGQACVTFGYGTDTDAKNAADRLRTVVATADKIMRAPAGNLV